MSQGPTPARLAPILLGMLVLVAVPVSRWLTTRGPEEGATARLLREKQASLDEVARLAKQELGCDDVKVEDTTDGIFATGCAKEARWVRSGDVFQRAGEITTVDPGGASQCPSVFRRRERDAGEEANDDAVTAALAAVRERKHTARLLVPVEESGLHGFAKLRWGDHVVVSVGPDDVPPKAVTFPCPTTDGARAADAGADATCTVAFHHVSEVQDCP